MVQQVIDTTTPQPNGKQGEPIRTAFDKTNANFTELYSGLEDVQEAANASLKAARNLVDLSDTAAARENLGLVELFSEKAEIGGSASQRFKVAPSVAADEAVRQAQVIGISQSWQTLTVDRLFQTNYVNDTGKPILVNAVVTGTSANPYLYIMVDSGAVNFATYPTAGIGFAVTAIVPAGSVYRLEAFASKKTLIREYR